MVTIVFDNNGQSWNSKGSALRLKLGYEYSDIDLPVYCVKNLGFIAVTVSDGIHHIMIRTQSVASMAFNAVAYFIADSAPSQVVIHSFGSSGWENEIHEKWITAIEKLTKAIESDSQRSRGIFKAKNNTNIVKHHQEFGALIDQWADAQGHFDSNRFNKILNQELEERYVLVYPTDGSRLRIQAHGRGLNVYGDAWRAKAIGQRIQDLPDYDYGVWVGEAYRSVLETKTPLVEDVDVLINKPLDRVRLRYSRVILPCTDEQGSECILATSLIDNSVNLLAA